MEYALIGALVIAVVLIMYLLSYPHPDTQWMWWGVLVIAVAPFVAGPASGAVQSSAKLATSSVRSVSNAAVSVASSVGKAASSVVKSVKSVGSTGSKKKRRSPKKKTK